MKLHSSFLVAPLTFCSCALVFSSFLTSCAQQKAESSAGPSAIAEVVNTDDSTFTPTSKKSDRLEDKSNPIEVKILSNQKEEPYYLINKGQDIEIHVKVKTLEAPGSKVKLSFKIKDFWEKNTYNNESETVVDSNNLVENVYKTGRLDKLGYYQIEVLVNQKNLVEPKKARKFTYSFGVVDPAIATSKLESDSPYGICMRGKIIDNTMIQTLQRVGIKWVRNGILARWSDVEKERGKFDFAENSDFIRRLNNHGISRLERLDGIAPWERQVVQRNEQDKPLKKARKNQAAQTSELDQAKPEAIAQNNPNPDKQKKKKKAKDPSTLMLPKNLDAWKQYVQTTVSRLYPGAAYYEVWNEPDIPQQYWQDSMENYVKLLNAAYDAKKQANPEASILMAGFTGGFSNLEKPHKRKWFELVLQTGKYDVINFHSYGGLALHEQRYKDLSEILRKYNLPKKPIWVTETGSLVWHADNPKKQSKKLNKKTPNNESGLNDDRIKIFSEKEQARNYIQNFLVSKSYGVDKLFTHANVDATHNEDYGVIRKNHTPRPWMLAQAALAKWVYSAKFVKSTQDKTLRSFVFQRDGKQITVLFTPSGTPGRFLVNTTGAVEFIDIMGNTSNQVNSISNTQYSLNVNDYPVYIIGAVSKIQLD